MEEERERERMREGQVRECSNKSNSQLPLLFPPICTLQLEREIVELISSYEQNLESLRASAKRSSVYPTDAQREAQTVDRWRVDKHTNITVAKK